MYFKLKSSSLTGAWMEFNLAKKFRSHGRRKHRHERRYAHRSDRRARMERREDTFTRALVAGFKFFRLHGAVDVIRFFKAIKVFDPLVTFLSGVLSASAYSYSMKPAIAMGLVLALAVHEGGHYLATKHLGLKTRWWLHVPMLGAIMPSPYFRTREDEAWVAYGGPLVGGAFSLALFLLWGLWASAGLPWHKELLYVAVLSAALNLFNLIPLSPIDGGRITQIIHGVFRWIGFLLLLSITYWYAEAAMLVIWMVILDGIRMNHRTRFVFAAVLLSLMPVGIYFGYHSRWIWEDWIYFVFGVWLLYAYYVMYRHPSPEEKERRERPLPSANERWRWLLRFLALTIALAGLLALELWTFGQYS